MSAAAEKICIEALSLPSKSRAALAERLLTSLEEEERDAENEKAWKKVIRRRRSEIRSGRAKVRPAEDVLRDAFDAIK